MYAGQSVGLSIIGRQENCLLHGECMAIFVCSPMCSGHYCHSTAAVCKRGERLTATWSEAEVSRQTLIAHARANLHRRHVAIRANASSPAFPYFKPRLSILPPKRIWSTTYSYSLDAVLYVGPRLLFATLLATEDLSRRPAQQRKLCAQCLRPLLPQRAAGPEAKVG